MIKVLNLYAGIGGNRKFWSGVNVTAIELNPQIAKIYGDFFPKDEVIIEDAHKYLLVHFEEFDFIWSSPPCPSHSKARKLLAIKINKKTREEWLQNKPIYPDMKLYEEILLLKHYFRGKWVIENVVSFYEPLIKPQKIGSHYFWSNFHINTIKSSSRKHDSKIATLQERKSFDLSKYNNLGVEKKLILRNCVEPELGLHVFNCGISNMQVGL